MSTSKQPARASAPTHPITKLQVIAVIQALVQIAAALTLSIPDSISAVLIANAGIIAVGLTFAEAHLLKGRAQYNALTYGAQLVRDALPVITSLTGALPTPIGPEVHLALQDLQAAVDKLAAAPKAVLPEFEVTVHPKAVPEPQPDQPTPTGTPDPATPDPVPATPPAA